MSAKVRAIWRTTRLSAAYLLAWLLTSVALSIPAVLVYKDRLEGLVAGTLAMSLAALLVTQWFLRTDASSLSHAGLRLEWPLLKDWCIGFALGLFALTLVVALPLAAGTAKLIRLDGLYSAKSAVMWVAFFAVQSMGEEVICRGYLLRVWTRSLNLYVGLLVSSIFFALAHIGNAGFDGLGLFNTVICGAILGVVYAKTGSLWLVGGIHAGWNAAQPLFGMNVGGFQIRFAALETRFTGGNLWSGGQYGPEGSLPATVILLLFVIAMQVRGPMARNDFGVFGVDLSPKPLMPDPLKCQATEARNMDSD